MKYIFLKTIRLYKRFISPVLHYLTPGSGCRFHPTCSEYSYRAIKKLGIIKGSLKSMQRIVRCNPLNKGGYDPF